LNGQATLLVGLLTLVLFFLPWYAAPDPQGKLVFTDSDVTISNTVTYPGVSAAASGLSNTPYSGRTGDFTTGPAISVFLYLWLVPLVALAVMAVAWFLSRGRLAARTALLALIGGSALTVVLELSFLVAINGLQDYQKQSFSNLGIRLEDTWFSVSWGFWLALVVSLAGLAFGLYQLAQERRGPAPGVAQPYGGQYAGVPPAYPGR
jgi:hypothetical protein